MLKLAIVALSALLVLSPAALASSTDTIAAEATPRCVSLATLSAKVPAPIVVKLEGDKLAAFRVKSGAALPNIDLLVAFGEKGEPVYVVVFFVKGCAIGYEPVPAAAFAEPTPGADDGSI